MAAAALATIASCAGDNPTAPPATESHARRPAPEANSSALLFSGPATVVPLQRTAPIGTELASATVGILGGYLTLWKSGLTLVVPPFAVRTPVTITATALAGTDVAYELAPHGLSFNLPLVAIQSLRETQAGPGGLINPLSLVVGYFPSTTDITSVTEILDVGVNLHHQTAAALIWHFSGYVWSSGRSADQAESEGGPQ
jgi:hypothetical protein